MAKGCVGWVFRPGNSQTTGFSLEFLSSDDLTLTPNKEEKIRLCEALNLNRDYILDLPLKFGEGKIVMIRKSPLTPEMERMAEIGFDVAFGIEDDSAYDDIF